MDRPNAIKRTALILVTIVFLSACNANAVGEQKGSLCVATWNVQNLFDAELNGSEYDEYKPQNGWTSSMYERRLSNAGKVLASLPSAKDYIVVLNEIENSKVLEDLLLSRDMSNMGICYYAVTNEPDSAIQTGVASSLPILEAYVHQVGSGLRPILEVDFDMPMGKVFVLAVHFKSNVGGTSQTSQARRESAKVVAEISSAIQKNNPGCLVLVCGDMNEECWDDNALGKDSSCILPVGPTFERGKWYCPWMDESLGLISKGSYFYNGDWKCYDNILISMAGRDGYGLELKDCGILFEKLQKTADGKPFAWNRNLLTG
ncbi:MAG: endonuclease/exonuclease/phosphatase family protein, partial [Sphaerochaetaceae bacterium]|nr:endonuclease/exonuclease/phosphatase family protein [Sphaerochaetaceae bacterium]